MLQRQLAFVFVLMLVLAGQASGQRLGPPTDYVSWEASLVPPTVEPGGQFSVKLRASINSAWKMYAMDSPPPSRGIRFMLDDLPQGITQRGDVIQSDPNEAYDEGFEMDVTYFKDQLTLDALFEVDETALNGTQQISGEVTYQICNDELRVCLAPASEDFAVSFVMQGGLAGDVSDAGPPGDANANQPGVAGGIGQRAGGFWGFILLAIGAGLGALLMPCTFPMIPLTVSYFTKHADNRGEAFRMASVYGLSIIVIFTGLGLLMALLLGASGAQTIAANPWINLSIGLIFVVFGLSLLGLFELRLPNAWLNFFNRKSNEKKGYAGVLFMGTTLTLVSFSCTAPFVGTLLAATAGGEWSYPVLGMLVFSAVFACPFVLFALFPSGLSRLPASGSWMNTLKVVFGFIELAAALKFLSNADLVWGWNLISRPFAISLTVVILFVAGLYLLGKLRLAHEEKVEQIGTVRLMAAISFLGISLYMLPGLFGAPLNKIDAFLPPRQGTDMSLLAGFPRSGDVAFASDEGWFEDRASAFSEAKKQGKPVFIDFTGYTCTNCRQMEANVFPDPTIVDLFETHYVLLKLYTDDLDKGPDLQRYQLNLTGTVALPTYAIVDPVNEKLIAQISGMRSTEEFAAFLNNAAAYFERNNLTQAR